MSYSRQTLPIVVLGSLLAACGGSAIPTAPGGHHDEPQLDRMIMRFPEFKEHIQEILVRNGCTDSNCHGIGQGGMTLGPDADRNYTSIVNVPSESETEFFRIEPFKAANSYLVIKLEGRQRVGALMGPIDNIDLTNLKNWINYGAPNN